MTYFCPALDPPLDGSGRKITTLVRDLEYFIHTKFHQNPSIGSGEEVENVNSLTDDGRTDDGRTTDAGQRVITIGHWSLWLLCPKNVGAQVATITMSKTSVLVPGEDNTSCAWPFYSLVHTSVRKNLSNVIVGVVHVHVFHKTEMISVRV